jgi:hypothetical protein
MALQAGCRAVSSAPEAMPPALLPADASRSETGASDASACARPDEVAAGLTAHPVAAAEKSVVPEPGVPAQDAPSHLPEFLQHWRVELVARAPYIPDAVQSAARSSSVAELAAVPTRGVQPVGQPWPGRAVATEGAAEMSLPQLRESRSRLAPRVQPRPVAGPQEPTKPLAVPEAQAPVEPVAAL